MIKAVIYDLDNCIFQTSLLKEYYTDYLIKYFLQYSSLDLPKELIKKEFWDLSLEEFAQKYNLPLEVIKALQTALSEMQVRIEIVPFQDVTVLKEISALQFLVTTGFFKWQKSKIEKLGIQNLFSGIYIDPFDPFQLKQHNGKKKIFQTILKTYQLKPYEVLVIGDNISSEIAAGNQLGMKTVQILRPHVDKREGATYYVHDLFSFKELLNSLSQ